MERITELVPPTAVHNASRAMEVARIWIVDKKQVVAISGNLWADPAAWGLMLVDLARHVAKAYAKQGVKEQDVLDRILEAFNAEWEHPTDEPVEAE